MRTNWEKDMWQIEVKRRGGRVSALMSALTSLRRALQN
jgi:hypothetical protein